MSAPLAVLLPTVCNKALEPQRREEPCADSELRSQENPAGIEVQLRHLRNGPVDIVCALKQLLSASSTDWGMAAISAP